eukprot:jgi/Psemu1/215271/e_gw1.734.8.1
MPGSSSPTGGSGGGDETVQSLDPVFFPPRHDNHDGEAIHEDGKDEEKENDDDDDDDDDDDSSSRFETFSEACQFAADSHRPLHLRCDVRDLQETIVLRKRQFLTIRGEDNKNNSEDCRKVGAAVNLRYKSGVVIEDSSLTSHAGFCCWAVQKATMHLERSFFSAPLRSALVCFGQTVLECRSSTIADSGVHGVCARGECLIRIVDCSLVDAAVRGLYAYANASVFLEGCSVRGTVRPDKAAIEVASAMPSPSPSETGNHVVVTKSKPKATTKTKTSSLVMKACTVTDNAGVGVRIRGGVEHDICLAHGEDEHQHQHQHQHEHEHEPLPGERPNYFARNAGGNDIDFRPATGEGNADGDGGDSSNGNDAGRGMRATTRTTTQQQQRDASGSSFRKGDWWCQGCLPQRIVPGSRDSCPACGADKSTGRLLSTREVIQWNRGNGSGNPGGIGGGGGGGGRSVSTTESDPERALTQTDAAANDATWWFDADGDDDVGWRPYDAESNEALERAFRSIRCRTETETPGEGSGHRTPKNSIVLLSNGKHRVDLETMEQTNTESHFLRLVQRREGNRNRNRNGWMNEGTKTQML